jgi:hypothetical protein
MKSAAMCNKGLHRLTADNTYVHPTKGAECRECKRAYMRDYMRTKRAERHNRRGPRRS